MKLSDLPDAWRHQAERQIARDKPLASAQMSRRELLGGYRSKLERDYAGHLMGLVIAGEVDFWVYECELFRITIGVTETGRAMTYLPDFFVAYADGRQELVEVKGYCWRQDRVRIGAARGVSKYPLVVVTRERGAWRRENGKVGG